MKTFLLMSFLMYGVTASAMDYFVSNDGNDLNPGNSPSSPWKTLDRVNKSFGVFKPGDKILFKRGDIFYGSISVTRGGTDISPITIGAYGSGDKPVITGFTSVTSWANLGGNIWESSGAVSSLARLNMVVINGANTPMGRWPNAPGEAIFQNHSGDNSITSDTLSSMGVDWTGAEVVLANTTYTVYRGKITSQSGNVLNYTPFNLVSMWQNRGGDRSAYYTQRFVIQNDPRVCDLQNEWYYNSSTKKIGIYSTSKPSNVFISTVEALLTIQASANYINVEDIKFTGSNSNSILFSGDQSYIIIRDCEFDFCGQNTIYGNQQGGGTGKNIGKRIINCSIDHSNNMAISLGIGNTQAAFQGNVIKNTGLFYGMLSNGGSGISITATGAKNIFDHNKIDSSGYIGIDYRGDSSVVSYNLVTNTCIREAIKDGGAIYTWNQGGAENKGRRVFNNIVINTGINSNGIYFDGGAAGVEAYSNTVANSCFGLSLNSWNMSIHDNTFYNNYEAGILFRLNGSTPGFHDVSVKKNILFAKLTRSFCAWFTGDTISVRRNMISDSNFYAKPLGVQNRSILTYENGSYNYYNLTGWQGSGKGHDLHSIVSPETASDENQLRFEYNATDSLKTITLDGLYTDAKGLRYNGIIVLQPWTSAVLIRLGKVINSQLSVNAGTDKIITLPVNEVLLSGSGSNSGGSIFNYLWTKISGPDVFKIVSSNSASTKITDLVEGIYVFELKITDENGISGTAKVNVTVKPVPNIPPIAIGGVDKVITLPANIVSLAGSGSDADGKIVSYLWSKISGPATFKIVNPSSPVTDVTGLVEGEYVFELKVTDDRGESGKASVHITVKASSNLATPTKANVPPKAYAGNDTTIAAPVTFITLEGTGTDADGRITGYLWTQVSGPTNGTLSSETEALVNVSNLIEGAYEFELKVTDNEGGEGKDTVRITVVATRMASEVNNVMINPNPVNDLATLEINNSKNNTNLSVLVTDISGKTIYKEQFVSQERKLIKQIDMRNTVRGTYIVTVVFDGTEKASAKIVRM